MRNEREAHALLSQAADAHTANAARWHSLVTKPANLTGRTNVSNTRRGSLWSRLIAWL